MGYPESALIKAVERGSVSCIYPCNPWYRIPGFGSWGVGRQPVGFLTMNYPDTIRIKAAERGLVSCIYPCNPWKKSPSAGGFLKYKSAWQWV